MTSWAEQTNLEGERTESCADPYFWHHLEDHQDDEHSNDLFSQFVDFDADESPHTLSGMNSQYQNHHGGAGANDTHLYAAPHSLFMDPPGDSTTGSSGPSPPDDLDFLSNSSNFATGSAVSVGQEIDTKAMALLSEVETSLPLHPSSYDHSIHLGVPNAIQPFGEASISDIDLHRLQDISLNEPGHNLMLPAAQPASPMPTSPAVPAKKSNKIIDTLTATVRKATTRRKPKKQEAMDEAAVSPMTVTAPPPPPAQPKKTRGRGRPKKQAVPIEPAEAVRQHPPPLHFNTENASYLQTFDADPFTTGFPPQPAQYPAQPRHATPYSPQPAVLTHQSFSLDGGREPSNSLGIGGGGGVHQSPPGATMGAQVWQQPPPMQHDPATLPWNPDGYNLSAPPWLDAGMLPQNGSELDSQQAAQANYIIQSQQSDISFQYNPLMNTDSSGLMIHMPQPRQPPPMLVNDLAVNGQTYLPPPAPPPGSDRGNRPPRARSSGARHLSSSPMHRARAPPNVPPSPGARSRHSSGGSVTSLHSVTGGTRLPASMPGTPCSVRKRRSRDMSGSAPSGSRSASSDLGGFVNFTPSDSSALMSGVAPSGSSKTKARREREAQERRQKMNEAAVKAIKAVGGDLHEFIGESFSF